MRRERAADLPIARLAGAQHGVVGRAQLQRLGLGIAAIDHRLRAGRLHLIHRGVYAVGHRVLAREGRWMAAVLSVGVDAVLSHATAATAWDLRPARSGAIHVTVPGDSGRRRRAGIRVHRSTTLEARDTTSHLGIPITTPARTFVDLATALTGRPLELSLDLADQHRLIDFAELRARPSRAPSKRCCPATPPPRSPAASSRSASARSATATACHGRSPTWSSRAGRSTSRGAISGWSSRSTAPATTARPRRSRTTASATCG